MNKYEVLETIAGKLGLSEYDHQMLIHDVNNLRGKEWMPEVRKACDKELVQQFKMILNHRY